MPAIKIETFVAKIMKRPYRFIHAVCRSDPRPPGRPDRPPEPAAAPCRALPRAPARAGGDAQSSRSCGESERHAGDLRALGAGVGFRGFPRVEARAGRPADAG